MDIFFLLFIFILIVIFFLIIRRNKNQSYDRYYSSTDSYSNSLLISNDS